ncbi:hypothetical protein NECAME_16811 [Necator americanus]|uniref:Protein kinase domain-containing protein n=1 Tax=Necator americanus TaxID=51031 RepID=W2TWE5_NECAM|nr:hypothetical protein NECAME_16811 [Necator americanus]ETN85327.1 hypothetical protein NECAME_16811 [Necator americanus]
MMVARVKADDREVRSEPPTCVSINEESGSDNEEPDEEPQTVKKFVASRRSHDEAPTQKPRYTREDKFSRTVSAQSLPVSDRLEELSQMTVYDRTLHMLAVDPIYQKEVALGKRIGFYRLGKELGAGNFSKVKLGIHVLTKGLFFL